MVQRQREPAPHGGAFPVASPGGLGAAGRGSAGVPASGGWDSLSNLGGLWATGAAPAIQARGKSGHERQTRG